MTNMDTMAGYTMADRVVVKKPVIESDRIERFANTIEDLVMNNTGGPEEFELYMRMLAQEFNNRYPEDSNE
jgi:hypothetical protein